MKMVSTLLVGLIFVSASLAQVKKPEPPPVKAPFSKSLQMVVVTTKDWNTVTGKAQLFQRKNENAEWTPVDESFPILVGRNGLALDYGWRAVIEPLQPPPSRSVKDLLVEKIEGDGRSPAGVFPLTAAFGTGTKSSKLMMPYTKLDEFTECVDDTRSSHYNRIVNRMQVGNFDWKSSEKMFSIVPEYDLGIFVGYNSFPVEKGKGSCIFMHIWKDASTATDGCTAMERRNLELLMSWILADKNPYLVQMPEDLYNSSRKTWKLPKIK